MYLRPRKFYQSRYDRTTKDRRQKDSKRLNFYGKCDLRSRARTMKNKNIVKIIVGYICVHCVLLLLLFFTFYGQMWTRVIRVSDINNRAVLQPSYSRYRSLLSAKPANSSTTGNIILSPSLTYTHIHPHTHTHIRSVHFKIDLCTYEKFVFIISTVMLVPFRQLIN